MKKKYTDIKKGAKVVSFTDKEIRIQDREGKNIAMAIVDRRDS
jgi:hypothetical protein